MFGLSNFIITEFLLIFYSLVTNVLYSYIYVATKRRVAQASTALTVFGLGPRLSKVVWTTLLFVTIRQLST